MSNLKKKKFDLMNDQTGRRRHTMWGVVAAWVVCLASFSLPSPGATLIVLLCCVAFFELASAWVGKGGTPPAPSTLEEMSDRRTDPPAVGAPPAAAAAVARRWPPSAALAAAFQFLAGRLRLRAGWRGGLEEVGVTAAGGGAAGDGVGRGSAAPSKERPRGEVRNKTLTLKPQMLETAARFPHCLQYRTARNANGRVLCLPPAHDV